VLSINRIYTSGRAFLVLLTLLALPSMSAASEIERQRELFRQGEQAIRSGSDELLDEILNKLESYPAVAYLRYDDFEKNLGAHSPDEVREFLDRYEDYPFRYHLLSRWLNLLAKRGQWQLYLDFNDGRTETRFKCQELTARLETGNTLHINKDIRKIWLSGYSQPDACDRPFAHFLQTQEGVNQDIWARIEKAFQARRSSLALYLAKKLDTKDQAIVRDWNQAHRNSGEWLQQLGNREDNAINRKVILHALDRLARKDSLAASEHWARLSERYRFSDDQIEQIAKRLALSAALQHKTEAKQWLEELPDQVKNDTAHLWLARIHLRDEDWIGLIKSINAMPQRLKSEAEWRYWLARAYAEAGHQDKAMDMFKSLSERSTYYGFLAADRSEQAYTIDQQQVTNTQDFDEQAFLAQNVHLLRARELFFLDRQVEARREWFQGIRRLSIEEIKQAAQMASDWKWYENAIKTVAKTEHRQDYDLRFPMPYQDLVMSNIKLQGLDPSVIYGVMRRESLFDPLAKSRVGALGLMQLMPSTARRVAKSLGLKSPRQSDILEVSNNIRLGTQYFRTVLNQFDDNVSLAAAAYNAGPRNVKRWLPKDQSMQADLWIETVPYKETRNYVQAVLAYATIFDKHLGKDVQISSRMNDVKTAY
jgi:soluble lytic murein transglycosylase